MEIEEERPLENRNIFRAISKNVRKYGSRRKVGSMFRDVPDLRKNDSRKDMDFGGDLIANYNNYVSSMTSDNNDNDIDGNYDYEDTNTDNNDVSVASNGYNDGGQGYKFRKLQRNFDKYLTRNNVEELDERGSFRMVQKSNKNMSSSNTNSNRNSHNYGVNCNNTNNNNNNNNNSNSNNNVYNNNHNINNSNINGNMNNNLNNNNNKNGRKIFDFSKRNNNNNVDNKNNDIRTKSQRFSTINEEEQVSKKGNLKEIGGTAIIEKNKNIFGRKTSVEEKNKNEKIMKMNIDDQKSLFLPYTAQYFISSKINAINKLTKQYSDAAISTIKNILFEPENPEK